jgi:hypothetical protein
MKKAILIGFIAGIAMIFGSPAMALEAPIWDDTCSEIIEDNGDDYVCFGWEPVEGAFKYTIDVEVPVYTDGVDEPYIVELSFGTSDRTDGNLMSDSDLCVPLTDFVYDHDNDPGTDPVQLSGDASAKVRALAPGKGKGRQNHPFNLWSSECNFVLP